jgi:hypothetical protein
MTLVEEAHRLRLEVARLRSDRARRYPLALRQAVLDWVERAKHAGMSEGQCSADLGIPTKRFERWRGGRRIARRAAVVRVAVQEPSPAAVSFVTPSGYRIEGITIEQAVAMIRVLS